MGGCFTFTGAKIEKIFSPPTGRQTWMKRKEKRGMAKTGSPGPFV
jgi:hypothetical protein